MSWTKPGFSTCEYGVDHGAPKAAVWKCARRRNSGAAPRIAQPAARGVARPERSQPSPTRRAAGAEGYSAQIERAAAKPKRSAARVEVGVEVEVEGEDAARSAGPRPGGAGSSPERLRP